MKNILDNWSIKVIIFGIFMYTCAKLIPYRNELIPIMLVGNMITFSLFTLAFSISCITKPILTQLKFITFMLIILNFSFFYVLHPLSIQPDKFFRNDLILYVSGVQAMIALLILIYVLVKVKLGANQ